MVEIGSNNLPKSGGAPPCPPSLILVRENAKRLTKTQGRTHLSMLSGWSELFKTTSNLKLSIIAWYSLVLSHRLVVYLNVNGTSHFNSAFYWFIGIKKIEILRADFQIRHFYDLPFSRHLTALFTFTINQVLPDKIPVQICHDLSFSKRAHRIFF